MASFYTKQLVNAVYSGAFTGGVYGVPAASIAIITDIEVWLSCSAAGQLSYLQLGSAVLLYRTSTAADAINQQWTGKLALTAAQGITFSTQSAVATLAITGYVLPP